MQHVVSNPTPPFKLAGTDLEVHQVPSWADNLIWLIVDPTSKQAAAVDGPEADSVEAYAEANGLTVSAILNTHTHGDHIGINRAYGKKGRLESMRVIGARSRTKDIPGLTEGVGEGDTFDLFGAEVRVL